MKLAILSANLGSFDKVVEPVEQELPKGIDSVSYHCFTDSDFLPITGLTPRFQYRIPKLFGWQMWPDYDYYIWLDGVVSFKRPDCLKYYVEQLGDADMCFFAHPNRGTIQEEVDHLDDYLNRRKGTKRGQDYLIKRYQNGLHKEQLADIQTNKLFKDNKLYASTTFIYRDNNRVRDAMRIWWLNQSRYFTCDQVALPFVLWQYGVNVKIFDQPIYKTGYMSLVSQHD